MTHREEIEDFNTWMNQNVLPRVNLVEHYDLFCRQRGEPPVDSLPQFHKPKMHGPARDYKSEREAERRDIEDARKNGVGSMVHHPKAGPVLLNAD